MLLKNLKPRLITINGKFDNGQRVEKFQIKPGNNPAVEVPDHLCETPFVKALIADGSLQVLAGAAPVAEAPEDEVTDYSAMDRADLIVLCENRGIEVIKQDSAKTLAAKLLAKDAEEAAAE